MQNPNEDTEWNDILRSKGILPPKEKEITEDDVVSLVEQTVKEKQGKDGKSLDQLNLDELDELEDEEDEKVLLEYRQKRIAEMKAWAKKAKFGSVIEITAQDYVEQVNNAGEGIWVVVLLYKPGEPMCNIVNECIRRLAAKFPETKFIRSISSLCVPNYPDYNLPAIFIYYQGELKQQIVGQVELGTMNMTCNDLEWVLSRSGAVKTDLTHDPRPKIEDVLFADLSKQCWKYQYGEVDDDDDDY